jgi:hypothetical protein
MRLKLALFIALLTLLFACNQDRTRELTPALRISENGRYLATENGDPFFWLGDTGWLLFKKLSREEAGKYFNDRKQKGFNVIQVMVIHNIKDCTDFYGDSALINHIIDCPLVTEGSSPGDPEQYDYAVSQSRR